jgi:hypothetical protein
MSSCLTEGDGWSASSIPSLARAVGHREFLTAHIGSYGADVPLD